MALATGSEFVSVRSAANELGVSDTTVRTWVTDGRLVGRRDKVGTRERWSVSSESVARLRREQTRGSTSEPPALHDVSQSKALLKSQRDVVNLRLSLGAASDIIRRQNRIAALSREINRLRDEIEKEQTQIIELGMEAIGGLTLDVDAEDFR